jgi:hypothetical protein
VTTSAERLQALRARALAADIEPVSDPEELTRRGVRAHLQDTGGFIPPDRPEMDVRMHGPGVPAHDIPVREAAGILGPLQEAVASIGQALVHKATASGRINADILRSTELRLSPVLAPGSVVFHLTGPAEEVSGAEAPELIGNETLVDAVMRELFALVGQAENVSEIETAGRLAHELRRFGSRTAKHLTELTSRVVDDEIDLDLTWRTPVGRIHRAALQRRSAETIQAAIKLNEVEVCEVELTGDLVTVSMTKKAELHTQDLGNVALHVHDQLATSLGPFFNKQVVVTAELTTRWLINTGTEKRSYRMLGIRVVEDDGIARSSDSGNNVSVDTAD